MSEPMLMAHREVENTQADCLDDCEAYEVTFEDYDVEGIRRAFGMSQREFASSFGVALGSVRNWEQGRAKPDASMQSYLAVILHEPEAVLRALGRSRNSRAVRRVR